MWTLIMYIRIYATLTLWPVLMSTLKSENRKWLDDADIQNKDSKVYEVLSVRR